MSNRSPEPRGCLALLFGFGGSRAAGGIGVSDPSANEEGKYHSGPGGYEGMGYSGGYAAEYRARHDAPDIEPEDSWADLDEGEEA